MPSSKGRRSPSKHSRHQQQWLARPSRWGGSVLGSASLQHTGWVQDQVFSKCCVTGMLFRGSNEIKLMIVIVQRCCAGTNQGLGVSWLTGEPSTLSWYGDSHEMALGRTPQRAFTDPERNVEIRDLFMPSCHISAPDPKDVTPKPNLRCPMALCHFICTHKKNVGA